MRYLLCVLFILCLHLAGSAQALRDINYRYLYNPEENFRFLMKTVKTPQGRTTFFKLELQDSITSVDDFTIDWQMREELSDKDGKAITAGEVQEQKHYLAGSISYPVQEKTILVAKVVSASQKRAWFFHQTQVIEYPVNDFLKQNNGAVMNTYINISQSVKIPSEGGSRLVSYYGQNFPTAVPAFSESQAKVSKGMSADSTFTVHPGQAITFSRKGLYLLQQDSSAKEGFAFRAEDDYPRLGKIESLADPLIYICTKEEFAKVKAAKGNKQAFDKVILSVTGDKDRAKNLFRSYFRRVELANTYFTSYKEGWKTDRGMIYIIFGLPDAVYKFSDREVWNYKNEQFKVDFSFVKSATVFDPENYVLAREKGIRETWYQVIDLWRNARF
jgi:GWxTD domain-containing protein